MSRRWKIGLGALLGLWILTGGYGLWRLHSLQVFLHQTADTSAQQWRQVFGLRDALRTQERLVDRWMGGEPIGADGREQWSRSVTEAVAAVDSLRALSARRENAAGFEVPDTLQALELLGAIRNRETSFAGIRWTGRSVSVGAFRARVDSARRDLALLEERVEIDQNRRMRAAGRSARTMAWVEYGSLAVTLIVVLVLLAPLLRLTATIGRLKNLTVRYARGEFDRGLEASGPDEIRELIVSFHAMGEQLQELDRLKSEFFNKLVHDFKSPLDNIKQSADVLLEDATGNRLEPPQREFLEIIKRSATNLRTMVQEQLNESKLLAGRTELHFDRLDIKGLILDRIQLQKPTATARRIRFAVKFTDAPFLLACDRSKIGRVVDNLLSNAIKYSPDTSTITVELDDRIEGMIEFRIIDQGPGVPANMQDKIFQKYVRLPGSLPGTGLGLFTAKYIVERHGGQIWVKSREGKGSSFHVLLPVTPDFGDVAR
jgi:signal transduction histidine kinase